MDKSRIHKVYAVTETLKTVMFPRFVNLTDTFIRWNFRRVHHSLGSSSWDRKGVDFSCKSQIRLIKKDSREYPANVDAFVNLRYTHRN